jgi:hypothetical protein
LEGGKWWGCVEKEPSCALSSCANCTYSGYGRCEMWMWFMVSRLYWTVPRYEVSCGISFVPLNQNCYKILYSIRISRRAHLYCISIMLDLGHHLKYMVQSGFNDMGLYNTSSAVPDILWYQIIPHW